MTVSNPERVRRTLLLRPDYSALLLPAQGLTAAAKDPVTIPSPIPRKAFAISDGGNITINLRHHEPCFDAWGVALVYGRGGCMWPEMGVLSGG